MNTMRTSRQIGALALAAALGSALSQMGCQDTSGGSGGGGSGGGTTTTTGTGGSASGPFTPKGCGFEIAPRPEYTDWSSGKTDVGATPNIRRVRRGLGGNVAVGTAGKADPATSVGFAWQTDDGTLVSRVAWGDSMDPASWPAENVADGVTWLTPAGALNGNGDARMHEVYVCGLTSAKTYYYRVGGGPAGKEVWSDVSSFTTTPNDAAAEVTIALTGDSRGQNENAWQVLQKKVLLSGVTMQMFSGDMINLATDQGEWEKWLDSASKDADGKPSTLGSVLTVSAHGNHDNHTSLFFGNMVLPQEVKTYPAYPELFFSFDVGPVHVVVIDDAFVVNPQGDAAYKDVLTAWLTADLDAADKNRAKVPWIIAMHHHPELSSSTHGKDQDVLRGRAFFVPVWDKYHVDVAVSGHDHDYERSKPVTGPAENPTIVPDYKSGTMYLVCAGAGADAYSAGTSSFTETSRDFKSGGAIGFYGLLKATKTDLTIDAHEIRADGSDPVFDTVTLTK
jgi:hypothetical protein